MLVPLHSLLPNHQKRSESDRSEEAEQDFVLDTFTLDLSFILASEGFPLSHILQMNYTEKSETTLVIVNYLDISFRLPGVDISPYSVPSENSKHLRPAFAL